MTRKVTRSSLLSVVFGVVLIMLAALAALAQTTGEGQRPAKSHAVLAPRMASAPRGLGPMDAGPLNFLPLVTYGSSGYPASSVVVADVNGDGKPDLVVANYLDDHGFCCTSDVDVLLGNGDGTFQAAVYYGSGAGGTLAVAIADVNSDDKLDLIVANQCAPSDCQHGSLGVLLGNGDGTFQTAITYGSGDLQSDSVAVADVNGDGKLDLLVANYGSDSGSLGVLLGNGDGTFQPVMTYNSGGPGAISLTVVDVNGDGKPDIAVANINTIGVLLGNGDGTFQAAMTYNSGGSGEFGTQVASGDVNGDGKADLLVAVTFSSGFGAVGVLLGNGDGTFQPEVTYDSGGFGADAITVADVNGDGKPDLAVTNASDNVGILLGNGDGTFQAVVTYDSGGGNAISVALADVNGDGKPDLAVLSEFSRSVGVLLNNYEASPTTTSLVSSANPADFNQMVTYTATVTGNPGRTLKGTMAFRDGGSLITTVTLTNNQATYTTAYPRKISTHAIIAEYSGNLHHAGGSRSATLTEYIRAPSITVVASSGSPTLVGRPVTFTATVTSGYGAIPDGELVTFHEGTTILGSGTLAGGVAAITTSALSGKTHAIKAIYAGDTTFRPSTARVIQIVEPYSTTTNLRSSENPLAYGHAVTFAARVESSGPNRPTGKVKFRDASAEIGIATMNNGVAKLTRSRLAVGTHPINAEYLGDAVSARSTSAAVNQVVK